MIQPNEASYFENTFDSDDVQAFISSVTHGFALLDNNLVFVEVNDTWLEQAGVDREQVIGKSGKVIFPGYKGSRREEYKQVIETGEPAFFEGVKGAYGNTVLDIKAFKVGSMLCLMTTDVTRRSVNSDRLMALHRHTLTLGRSVSVDDVAMVTLDTMGEIFGYPVLDFAVVNGDIIRFVESRKQSRTDRRKEFTIHEHGLLPLCVTSKETINVKDTRHSPHFYKDHENTLSELVVPVRKGGEIIALLNAESGQLNAFSQDDQALLELLAETVALALQNIHERESRQEYQSQVEDLYKHASHLASLKTIEEIAGVTVKALRLVLGFKRITFSIVNTTKINTLKTQPETAIMEFSLDSRSIMSRALKTNSTQIVPDVRNDPDYLEVEFEKGIRILSELDVPLRVDAEPVGVIKIQSERLDAFSSKDLHLLELFAEHISSVLTLLRHHDVLKGLHQFSVDVIDAKTVEEIAKYVMDAVQSIFGFDTGAFGIVEDGYVLCIANLGSIMNPLLKLNQGGITCRAINTGKSQLVYDTRLDPGYVNSSVEGRQTITELDVPVMIDGKAVAVINLESDVLGRFDDYELKLVEIMALHVSSAMEKIQQMVTLATLVSERTTDLLEANYRLEQMNEMKSRFITIAAHELRTPLTSVRGYLEILKDTIEETDTVSRFMEVLDRNTKRLEVLTDDLLDQQRITDGRLVINAQPVDLVEIIDDVILEMMSILTAKNQKIKVSEWVDFPRLYVDRIRVTQVFVNLLSNACKFSQPGEDISLDVKTGVDKVIISLKDNGFGIARDDIEKLFKPFPDIERPYVSEPSVGLGLSICRGIVDLHGGRIWAKSEGPDKGSTFTFTLPILKE